ncbi:prolipoprotein diacylglyceryl transferase family protein [Desulfobacterium sp. N47]|uniref:Prolipoprotein diacylglyceryl transferase n=1 Tax=uncultured Desulfobacterium sp. TaxID=201089 RepID=E1YA06_9BACT|nr:hypothetical protein N47_H22220 [uncultured Desulfobacterium sp.]
MNNLLFVGVISVVLAIVLIWGFKMLPNEKWQILGAIPQKKTEDGKWIGENFTYYGIFNATAIGFSVIIMLILLGSANVPLSFMLCFVVAILGLCVPASKIVARIVEKKSYTLSVGGAFFVGIILMPWIAIFMSAVFKKWWGYHISVVHVLSAILIAYAFGEGIGRLACISFGCCYGKPLDELSPFLRKVFDRYNFIYTGKTKKIAYASCLDGKKIAPVQAITCIICCLSGIIGIYLYLEGYPQAAFIETLAVTQIWRFLSEFLRADYRGDKKISSYQIMAFISFFYGTLIIFFIPFIQFTNTDIMSGMSLIWTPSIILFIQGIWWFTFFNCGRSRVTGATMTFYVHNDKI